MGDTSAEAAVKRGDKPYRSRRRWLVHDCLGELDQTVVQSQGADDGRIRLGSFLELLERELSILVLVHHLEQLVDALRDKEGDVASAVVSASVRYLMYSMVDRLNSPSLAYSRPLAT